MGDLDCMDPLTIEDILALAFFGIAGFGVICLIIIRCFSIHIPCLPAGLQFRDCFRSSRRHNGHHGGGSGGGGGD